MKKFKKSSAAKNSVLLLQSLGKTNPVGNGHVAALHSLTPLNNFLLLVQYIHSNGNLLIRTMWYRIYRKRERINVSLNVSSKMNRFIFAAKVFIIPFSRRCMSLSVLNPPHFLSQIEDHWLCIFLCDKDGVFSHVNLYSKTFNLRHDSSWLDCSKTQYIFGRTCTAQPSAAFLCAFQKIFWFPVSATCLNF